MTNAEKAAARVLIEYFETTGGYKHDEDCPLYVESDDYQREHLCECSAIAKNAALKSACNALMRMP